MRPENSIGKPFIELSEVGSSNNYAMQRVHAKMAEHGTVWFAHHQTAGKGQRGKTWLSQAGENITMSIVLEAKLLNLHRQFDLQAIVATACHDFLSSYAGPAVKIKWPNDLYWGDRKAGGILIENVLRGQEWSFAVVGIGMNVNQVKFDDELRHAVSLRQITGKAFNTVLLAKDLCRCIEHRWLQYAKEGTEPILDSYRMQMYKNGQPVMFNTGVATFTAVVKGVDELGNLLVDNGALIALPYGSVKWVVRPSNEGKVP